MNDATPIEPPADPLGRRRCPKCLYDRFGLAEGQACPECGYVMPAGFVVLSLSRPPASWRVAAATAVGIVAFLFFAARVPSGQSWILFIMLLPTAIVVLLRQLRIVWSSDAFVSQIWLSPAGIGIEDDADRTSPLRPVERALMRTVGFAPMLVMMLTSPAGLRLMLIPFGVIAGAFVCALWAIARNRRLARLPRVDDVAPRIYRWERVRVLMISPKAAGRVNVRLTLAGFFATPTHVQFAGDVAIAAAVERSIDNARASSTR